MDILEAFADRATIEHDFHDVKEVWGCGQQQVQNIWTNVAVYHLNLWMHTFTELWAWNQSYEQLCDRSDSPWDDTQRRPSHANRRKVLRQNSMKTHLSIEDCSSLIGHCHEKSFDLPNTSWLWQHELSQFSESAVVSQNNKKFGSSEESVEANVEERAEFRLGLNLQAGARPARRNPRRLCMGEGGGDSDGQGSRPKGPLGESDGNNRMGR